MSSLRMMSDLPFRPFSGTRSLCTAFRQIAQGRALDFFRSVWPIAIHMRSSVWQFIHE